MTDPLLLGISSKYQSFFLALIWVQNAPNDFCIQRFLQKALTSNSTCSVMILHLMRTTDMNAINQVFKWLKITSNTLKLANLSCSVCKLFAHLDLDTFNFSFIGWSIWLTIKWFYLFLFYFCNDDACFRASEILSAALWLLCQTPHYNENITTT